MRFLILLLALMASLTVMAQGEQSSKSADNRILISLKAEHKDFVLERMRRMLETLTAIQTELVNEQPHEVDELVQALMDYTAENHPDDLRSSMPDAFRIMSRGMNQQWRKLSVESNDQKAIQETVITIMNSCNSCHRAYRIE